MSGKKQLCDLTVTTAEQFEELRKGGRVLVFLHFDDSRWRSTAERLVQGGVVDYCKGRGITLVSVDVDSVPEVRNHYDFLSNPQAYAFGSHGVKLGTHAGITHASGLITSLIEWYSR